jgi:hypothetical protein
MFLNGSRLYSTALIYVDPGIAYLTGLLRLPMSTYLVARSVSN